jgi:hypothetical protein
MDPNATLTQLLAAKDTLKLVMEAPDPEAALLDAIVSETKKGNTDLQQALTCLVFGLEDLDEWLVKGGFLPARWQREQKQLALPFV